MSKWNDCAIIEIVENRTGEPGPGTRGLIKPNEVRINGQALWAPKGKPITVHEIVMNGSDDDPDHEVLQVTLTLWARRVFLGHSKESPETPERRVADAQQRLEAAQRELADAQQAAAST